MNLDAIKCLCESCQKEFWSFEKKEFCSEKCKNDWIKKNITSKLELAQALQKRNKTLE
jgi:hypothetical protein